MAKKEISLEDYRFGMPINYTYDPKRKKDCIKQRIRYIIARLVEMTEIENLPEGIDPLDVKLLLIQLGFAIMLKVNGKWYALLGSLGGQLNQNFRPTKAVVANAWLSQTEQFAGGEFEIGKDCYVIMNDSQYIGFMPLITKYATLLVENELSLYNAIINSRTQKVFAAGDDQTFESAEAWIRKIENGDVAVIRNPSWAALKETGLVVEDFGGTNAANTIITLIENEQYLWGSLLSEIGLRAPFNMKREALGDSEVSQMDMTLVPLVDDVINTQNYCWNIFNEAEGFNVKVKLASAWENIHAEVNHMEEVDEEIVEDDETLPQDENNEIENNETKEAVEEQTEDVEEVVENEEEKEEDVDDGNEDDKED